MVQEYRFESRWIIFGSGEMAHFEDVRKRIVDGEPIVEFLITPNDYIIDRYALKVGDEISRENGLMIRSYPEEYVRFLPIVAGNENVIVKTNLLGEPTDFSQEKIEILQQLKTLRKQVRSLSATNVQLMEYNDTMTTRYEKFFKRNREMYQLGQFSKPKEETEEGE